MKIVFTSVFILLALIGSAQQSEDTITIKKYTSHVGVVIGGNLSNVSLGKTGKVLPNQNSKFSPIARLSVNIHLGLKFKKMGIGLEPRVSALGNLLQRKMHINNTIDRE